MSAAAEEPQTETGTVTSADGTVIGYRQMGSGPGLVLVQGAMGTAANFTDLAAHLAPRFTVYLPDRRGRGASPRPYQPGHTVERDVEDLAALVERTGAVDVFGLSSGAVVALHATLALPALRRVVLYEPPLLAEGPDPALEARFHREVDEGDVAAALISAMHLARLAPPFVEALPRSLLETFTRVGLAREARKGPGRYASRAELVRALRYDVDVVARAGRDLERFRAVRAEVLLLGGSRSPAHLRAGLDELATVLPRAERVELPGVGHGAAWNADLRGRPDVVARALEGFLARPLRTEPVSPPAPRATTGGDGPGPAQPAG